MNTPSPDSPQNVCPKCGRPIIEGSPRGLCPLCLISEVEKDDAPRVQVPGPELDELRQAFPTLEIIEPLGAGGMGRVYKVRQPHLDRFGALKLLPPGLAEDPAWVERFTREARALARLNHPGIVQVYDFGEASTSSASAEGFTKKFPFLLMEFVDGVNLRQALRSGNLNAAEALTIVPPICAALQYAHQQGVMHRDIKPENILLDADGKIKIADFGVAKLANAPATPGATLTATGAQLGTAAYMAPEQIERPQDVDHRADIYSLGVVFYELLTGELPLGRFPAPSEKAGTDPRLDTIVFRTLEKERERRFQTAGEVKSEVEHVTTTQPPPMRPAGSAGSPEQATVTPRKTIALVLSLLMLPVLLVGLSLILPMAAKSGGSGTNFGLSIVGVMLMAATLTVIGFTWLFRRLQRAGISTAMAALIVALGLIIIPPAGCVTAIMIPAYMAHRTQRVQPMANDQVQIQRSGMLKADKKLTTNWRFTSPNPMWIAVDFRGARRSMELRPDGTGKYSAVLDAEIVLDVGTARLDVALGNGKDKSAGEVRFLAPADGWFDRVYDHSTADGLYGPGEYLLGQMGSDQLLLTISPVEPPKSESFVNFTVKSVSIYDVEKITMLNLEYTDEVEGDAELYFKTEGMEESYPPNDLMKPVSDRMELWKDRSWRMPAGVDPTVRQELKSAIESRYLNKAVKVPVGQVWQFFQAKLPDGTTAHVVMGARDGKRDAKGQPLEPQPGLVQPINAVSPGVTSQPFELQLSSSQTSYGVSGVWKVKSSRPVWVTVQYDGTSVGAEPREVDGRYVVEIKGAILRNVAPNASAFTFSASTGVGGRIHDNEVRFPDPQNSLRNFPILVPDGVHELGKPITIMSIYQVPVTVTVFAQPPPPDYNVQFTLLDVSLKEEEESLVLNVAYVARESREAEFFFKEEGIPASSHAVAIPGDAPSDRRVWKLPANLAPSIREFVERTTRGFLQRTIAIPSGESLQFFDVPLPDGKIAKVSIGARDRSQKPQ